MQKTDYGYEVTLANGQKVTLSFADADMIYHEVEKSHNKNDIEDNFELLMEELSHLTDELDVSFTETQKAEIIEKSAISYGESNCDCWWDRAKNAVKNELENLISRKKENEA